MAPRHCRGCGGKDMDEVHQAYLTDIKPEHTYQCTTCKMRVLEFEATPEPLRVWSDELHNQPSFVAFIKRRLAEKGLTLAQAP